MLDRLQQIQTGTLPNGLSFKDVLVQFANMQQAPPMMPTRPPETVTNRPPEHHVRPEGRRRPERTHEEVQKQAERMASPSPRLPPPPPYPEISLLPVTTSQETPTTQQNSLLHGILTKVLIASNLHCIKFLIHILVIHFSACNAQRDILLCLLVEVEMCLCLFSVVGKRRVIL